MPVCVGHVWQSHVWSMWINLLWMHLKKRLKWKRRLFKASALLADAFYKPICPCVCPCVHFLGTVLMSFCPHFLKLMSNIFRDSESLGKGSGKKWSQIWTFLFGSGIKLPYKKKVFFGWFCLTKYGGNHASQWIRDLWSKGVLLILAYF